jgi:Zn-finger nucleic acid-binding protein
MEGDAYRMILCSPFRCLTVETGDDKMDSSLALRIGDGAVRAHVVSTVLQAAPSGEARPGRPVEVANDFWRRAIRASVPSKRHCPSCSKPLTEFVARHEKQSLRLDLCRSCQLMWFDRGELEVFPKSQKKEQPSQIDQRIAMAQIQLESQAQEEASKFAYYVDVGLTVIIALLRLFR